MRFGELVVIRRVEDYVSPKGYRGINWECICNCGKTVVVRACNLRSGTSESCGCKRVKYPNKLIHGGKDTKLYNVWTSIKQRCLNSNSKPFPDYGGRGIKICDEWMSDFIAFFDWAIDNGYIDGLSIDRIDNDGYYCPDNCRWVSSTVQQNNKRNNHILTYNGESLTMSQWSQRTGIKYSKLKDRINKCGWSIEKSLTTP